MSTTTPQSKQHNPNSLDLVKQEPLKMIGSTPADREVRARTLVTLFVKFLSDHVDLVVQVRQDFLTKPKTEAIMGCFTFGEYCRNVLHYSESHIRRLIAGKNPATRIFDGSKNRAPALLEDLRTSVQRLHDSGFVRRCQEYDPVLLGIVLAQAMALDRAMEETDPEKANQFGMDAAYLEGVMEDHIMEKAHRKNHAEKHIKRGHAGCKFCVEEFAV